MAFDIKKEMEALDGFEADKEQVNEKVLELIRAKESAHVVVEIEGFKLKVKPTVSKRVMQIQKAISKEVETDDGEDLDAIQKLASILLASVCVEEPFTDPKTWMVVAEKTDDILGSVNTVLAKITETQDNIKTFRKK